MSSALAQLDNVRIDATLTRSRRHKKFPNGKPPEVSKRKRKRKFKDEQEQRYNRQLMASFAR